MLFRSKGVPRGGAGDESSPSPPCGASLWSSTAVTTMRSQLPSLWRERFGRQLRAMVGPVGMEGRLPRERAVIRQARPDAAPTRRDASASARTAPSSSSPPPRMRSPVTASAQSGAVVPARAESGARAPLRERVFRRRPRTCGVRGPGDPPHAQRTGAAHAPRSFAHGLEAMGGRPWECGRRRIIRTGSQRFHRLFGGERPGSSGYIVVAVGRKDSRGLGSPSTKIGRASCRERV